MRRRECKGLRARGFVRLKFLVALLVLAATGYVGAKLVPIYWNYLSMQDPVKEAAMAASRRGKEDEARADLIARAKSLGVALEEGNVEIDRDGNFVTVRVAWEVPVDMPLYRRTLRFRIEKRVPVP